jgi:hypothetical protein
MKTLFLALFLTFAMTGCKKIGLFQDDELSLSRQDYTGNQLRVDGYYYFDYANSSLEYVSIYFFYRNGIVLSGGSRLLSELPVLEESYRDGTFYNHVKSIKFVWGVHQIEGSNIKIEQWFPSEKPYRAYVREGVILNDTTFRITQRYRNQNGKKTEVESENEVYHFKEFSPNPDSTNSFVP